MTHASQSTFWTSKLFLILNLTHLYVYREVGSFEKKLVVAFFLVALHSYCKIVNWQGASGNGCDWEEQEKELEKEEEEK